MYDMPPDDKRLLDNEIKGEEEFNKELLAQRAAGGAQLDDDIFAIEPK
jgi:hypothetical protein